MEIVALGDSGLIIRLRDSLGAVLAVMRKLEAAKIPAVCDLVPAFASVAVFFESPEECAAGSEAVRVALQGKSRVSKLEKPRRIDLPVCYDLEFALDLATVAQHCRLSPNEVSVRHAAARYRVRCVGFTPGFPYLSGLPSRLATPRRATPRTSVPAGSVAIGGAQTGIYPQPSPGGWNIIGRTPLRLFDVRHEPPAFFRAGDQVRFLPMSREEFEQWGK